MPPDFDWSTYLLYHPDLRETAGVLTEEDAKVHYVTTGRSQGRFYKRLRVLLRYTACTGLINQQYSHIAAFALSAVLGAEIVLAPAVKRDSFANYFSTFKDQNEVSWTAAPLSSLLDVDSIVSFWQQRGLLVHRVRPQCSACSMHACLTCSSQPRGLQPPGPSALRQARPMAACWRTCAGKHAPPCHFSTTTQPLTLLRLARRRQRSTPSQT